MGVKYYFCRALCDTGVSYTLREGMQKQREEWSGNIESCEHFCRRIVGHYAQETSYDSLGNP